MNPNFNLGLQPRAFVAILLGTALVLAGPLIAMQFTDEMDWNAFDFAALAVVLLGGGVLFTLVASRARDLRGKTAIGVVVAVALALVVVELGVGLVGSPLAGS